MTKTETAVFILTVGALCLMAGYHLVEFVQDYFAPIRNQLRFSAMY